MAAHTLRSDHKLGGENKVGKRSEEKDRSCGHNIQLGDRAKCDLGFQLYLKGGTQEGGDQRKGGTHGGQCYKIQ